MRSIGSGTASASAVSAVKNTEITLTATPDEGYRFVGWLTNRDGVTIKNNKFYMPEGDIKVQANFEHICFDTHDDDKHTCDYPDCSRKVSGACWDIYYDYDHQCEECSNVLGTCEDADGDHNCDGCLNVLSFCEDTRGDEDHKCDLCGVHMDGEACWDNGENYWDIDGHTCDAIDCGKKIDAYDKSFCIDKDSDGKCEECGWVIGSEVVKPTAAPTVEPTVEPTAAPVAPKYEVKVDGKNGTITRTNDTSVVHEDMYVRYSVGYDMGGTSYAVIATVKVEWTETQEGVVGTFRIPSIQGAGSMTGVSYIVTTNANADELTVMESVKNSFGMLIK